MRKRIQKAAEKGALYTVNTERRVDDQEETKAERKPKGMNDLKVKKELEAQHMKALRMFTLNGETKERRFKRKRTST